MDDKSATEILVGVQDFLNAINDMPSYLNIIKNNVTTS